MDVVGPHFFFLSHIARREQLLIIKAYFFICFALLLLSWSFGWKSMLLVACHFLSVPFGISGFLVFYILVWYIWSNAKIQGTHHRVIPWALSSPTWVCLLSNFQSLGMFIVCAVSRVEGCIWWKEEGKVLLLHLHRCLFHIFYARVNWKISLNIDSQRMKLRGLLLICFWIITTLQISRMREYLDRDANRITEHSIRAKVQGSHGGPLTSLNHGFLLSWETMTAGCSKVGNFP